MRGVSTTVALSASALLALAAPSLAPAAAPAWLRAALAAYALFLAPGLLATAALPREDFGPVERLSLAFLLSLAAQTVTFVILLVFGHGIDAFAPLYACVLVVLAAVSALAIASELPAAVTRPAARKNEAGTTVIGVSIAALLIFDCVSAWHFTASGSIDRWWYLAYVRHWLDSPTIDFREPFLSGDFTQPRFGFNLWMLAMTAWTRVAAVDPVWLYHRACPLLLVPAAFASLYTMARQLFDGRRSALLAVVAGGLSWAGGALFPVSTRMPEDKVMALLVLAPLAIAAVLRWTDRPNRTSLAAVVAALIVLACNHPLIYALVLLVTCPYLALSALRRTSRPAVTVLALALLLAGALYPAISGMRAKQLMSARGASLEQPRNPVARVHLNRDRLWRVGNGGGYVVNPRLLARPLLLLALLALPLLFRRSQKERLFLLPATLFPLAVAFLPPLAAGAGRLVLPWMVYRVLWIVPFPFLLAIGLDEAMNVWRRRPWLPLAVVLIAAAPWPLRAWQERSRPQRQALAPPQNASFQRLLRALESLPADAVVAAAPELSERIPAMTGRRVLALSDRGTWVFAGSEQGARDRLRARAALMAGLSAFPGAAPPATHLLTAPQTPAAHLCSQPRPDQGEGFLLCPLDAHDRAPGRTLEIEDRTKAREPPKAFSGQALRPVPQEARGALRLVADCDTEPDRWRWPLRWSRTGPWSPALAQARCTMRLIRQARELAFQPRALQLEPLLGLAAEEFIVVAEGGRHGRTLWRSAYRLLGRDGKRVSLPLDARPIDRLRVEITPTYLPFIKLRELRLVLAQAAENIRP